MDHPRAPHPNVATNEVDPEDGGQVSAEHREVVHAQPDGLAGTIATADEGRTDGSAGEATIPVESREELVSLLCGAAELEHGLACSYLFAAFSLKRTVADGLDVAHVDAVNRWRKTMMDVAEEEMLHLALVCNLLTAIGSAPHLRRPPMPHRSRYHPVGMTIELRRFDEAALTRFIFLERPEHVEVEEAIVHDPAVDLRAEVPTFAPGVLGVRPVRDGAPTGDLATVGDLYDTIEAAFSHLVSRHGERNLFIGPRQAQAAGSHFEMHDLAAVTDLASARAALQTLTTQGEGVRGDWSNAHYGRFLAVREEFRQLVAADAGFDPAWPVLDNPTEHPDSDLDAVDNPDTLAVMRLFNSTYTLMTLMLLRWFAHTDENEAQLRSLARTCVDLMEDALAPLGSLLAQLPAHTGTAAPTAGASFEFYRATTLIPHRGAAWLIFHERLIELATHAGRLVGSFPSDVLHQVGTSLGELARRLEPHLAHLDDAHAVTRAIR